jgi:hypothetical protein
MKFILFLFLTCLSIKSLCEKPEEPGYSVPETMWPESFGNHRAIIEIPKAAEVVTLDILWRRHDRDPEDRRFIIINSSNGDTIQNIFRYKVNNEQCKIAFGPVRNPGIYYF